MRQSSFSKHTLGSFYADNIAMLVVAIGLMLLFFWGDANVSQYFFWPLLCPLFLSFRYGLLSGLGSGFLMFLIFHGLILQGFLSSPSYYSGEFIVGSLIVLLIAGEFSDSKEKKSRKAELLLDISSGRLNTVQLHYNMLSLSHHQLEQAVASQYFSLNEALLSLRSTMNHSGKVTMGQRATEIIGLFEHFAHVQVGALYLVSDDDVISPEPVAIIGLPQALVVDDSMVGSMFAGQQVVALGGIEKASDSVYTACIPFYDVHKHCHGVLLVDGLKFFSLDQQLLVLMSVLAGNIADLLCRYNEPSVVEYSDREKFHEKLRRATDTAKYFDISSQVIAIEVYNEGEEALALFDYITSSRRYMDSCFQLTPTRLYIMLIDTDESGAVGFMDRMNAWAKEQYASDLEVLDIDVVTWWCLPKDSQDLYDFIDNASPQGIKEYK